MTSPAAPVLIGSDGLEYEDLSARLLGEPRKSARNRSVQAYRKAGCAKKAIDAWIEAYDHWVGDLGCPVLYEGDPKLFPQVDQSRYETRKQAVEWGNRAAEPYGGVRILNALARPFATISAETQRRWAEQLYASATRTNPLFDKFLKPAAASPGGTGAAGVVQAAADSVHPAAQPTVRCRLGP